MRKIVALAVAVAVGGVGAAAENQATTIRSFLKEVNEALLRADLAALQKSLTSTVDYRDALKFLEGREAVTGILLGGKVWSEQTPPILTNERIKVIGASAAIVDGELVQYGSTVLKSSATVVLVLEKDGEVWKIGSLRLLRCGGPSASLGIHRQDAIPKAGSQPPVRYRIYETEYLLLAGVVSPKYLHSHRFRFLDLGLVQPGWICSSVR